MSMIDKKIEKLASKMLDIFDKFNIIFRDLSKNIDKLNQVILDHEKRIKDLEGKNE